LLVGGGQGTKVCCRVLIFHIMLCLGSVILRTQLSVPHCSE
jgi:hypothetical protein